jgi:hypothetical protein
LAFVASGVLLFLRHNEAGGILFLLACVGAGFLLPPTGIDTGGGGGASDSS